MENFTLEQMGAAYGLAKILSENDRREAEAVQGYTEQLAAILRAQEAFAGVSEVLEFLERLESATKEKIAELQKKQRTLEAQLAEEENLEIVRMVKAIKMDNKELTAFLKAYASGLITLPEDMMAADSGAETEETEDMNDEA